MKTGDMLHRSNLTLDKTMPVGNFIFRPVSLGSFFHAMVLLAWMCCLPDSQGEVQAQLPMPASSLDVETASEIDQGVNLEMKKQNLVGAAVGVIDDGKIVYLKGYGFSNRSSQKPFSIQTIANWASNSKPVVALLTMRMVEKRILRLEDRLRKFLPELPPQLDAVTIRHLLCHQSGFPHYSNGKILPLHPPIRLHYGKNDPVFSINRFGGSPLIKDPGEAYSYSSYAYVLLSATVQRAAKEPLWKLIQREFTNPLQMTSFRMDTQTTDQENWATGYTRTAEKNVAIAPEYSNAWKHGAGGYKSNIQDFAKWTLAIMQSNLITKKSRQLMWTPQPTRSGKSTRMGLGVFVTRVNGILQVSHNGSQTEARSQMVFYPTQKKGVVVLTNCSYTNPNKIATTVLETLSKRSAGK